MRINCSFIFLNNLATEDGTRIAPAMRKVEDRKVHNTYPQVEQYRQEVSEINDKITELTEITNNLQNSLVNLAKQ